MRTVFYIYNNIVKKYNKQFDWNLMELIFEPLCAGDGFFIYSENLKNLEKTLKHNVDESYKLITSIMDPAVMEQFKLPDWF